MYRGPKRVRYLESGGPHLTVPSRRILGKTVNELVGKGTSESHVVLPTTDRRSFEESTPFSPPLVEPPHFPSPTSFSRRRWSRSESSRFGSGSSTRAWVANRSARCGLFRPTTTTSDVSLPLTVALSPGVTVTSRSGMGSGRSHYYPMYTLEYKRILYVVLQLGSQ